jgi:hypothetical protein
MVLHACGSPIIKRGFVFLAKQRKGRRRNISNLQRGAGALWATHVLIALWYKTEPINISKDCVVGENLGSERERRRAYHSSSRFRALHGRKFRVCFNVSPREGIGKCYYVTSRI